ncbi:hypothetical protein [Ornithinimicrobium kibberense]|uniref:hypothetical protein n=1 Tax=Ornithinimicrobium kibberense TaxID=282060 RepID=UPI00360ACE7E
MGGPAGAVGGGYGRVDVLGGGLGLDAHPVWFLLAGVFGCCRSVDSATPQRGPDLGGLAAARKEEQSSHWVAL